MVFLLSFLVWDLELERVGNGIGGGGRPGGGGEASMVVVVWRTRSMWSRLGRSERVRPSEKKTKGGCVAGKIVVVAS